MVLDFFGFVKNNLFRHQNNLEKNFFNDNTAIDVAELWTDRSVFFFLIKL